MARFEKLNRITVGVFQLDLFTARTYFHVVAEIQAQFFERLNALWEIHYLKNHPIPSAGLLDAAVRHWAGTGRSWSAENQF